MHACMLALSSLELGWCAAVVAFIREVYKGILPPENRLSVQNLMAVRGTPYVHSSTTIVHVRVI